MHIWQLFLMHEAWSAVLAEKARLTEEVRTMVVESGASAEQRQMAHEAAWAIALLDTVDRDRSPS